MILFITVPGKGLTQEINGDEGSIWWAPIFTLLFARYPWPSYPLTLWALPSDSHPWPSDPRFSNAGLANFGRIKSAIKWKNACVIYTEHIVPHSFSLTSTSSTWSKPSTKNMKRKQRSQSILSKQRHAPEKTSNVHFMSPYTKYSRAYGWGQTMETIKMFGS